MTFDFLHTERLKLRVITPAILAEVFTTFDDDALMQFFAYEHPAQLEAEKWKYQKGYTNYRIDYLNFQLLLKPTDRCIWWCGFHSWYREHRRAEIGYHLMLASDMGKGFMSEAFGAVIRYGFEQMQLNRIEAMIGPENNASLKLVQKFGFTKEGHMQQHYFKNGQLEDSVIFALLQSTYNKME